MDGVTQPSTTVLSEHRSASRRARATRRRLARTLVASFGALLLLMQPAWADTTLETATTLSTNVALPTSVNVGGNAFSIRLSGVGGNIPASKTGVVNVVDSYSMSTSGVVTAGTHTTSITFPQINYNTDCPSSGVIPQGCPGNPFVVSATLTVATGTPGNTAGTLTVVASPGTGSGVTADATPALGQVKVITVNAAPTVSSIAGVTAVDEGSSGSYSVSAVDPDGDALTYVWSVTGNASPTGATNSSSVTLAFGDGPNAVSLQVSVDDGHGHNVIRTLSISVNNVAPTATFNAPASVNEGDAIALSLTGASDPSGADTTAGFTYAFDCGAGFGGFGSGSSTTCPTNDNGTRAVGGRIRDTDGGVTTYTSTVTVNNVAPSATFVATSPVNEGSDIGLSFSSPTDPSSTDTAAGFEYAFDCGDGAGFGAYGSTATATCPTTDNGTRTVGGRVRDKDGGVAEYNATASIDNVAPTATFGAPAAVDEGSAIALDLTGASDPSSADTTAGFTHAFDCGDGAGLGGYAAAPATSCSTDDNGTRTVGGSIRDKDGGFTTYTATVSVENVAPTATFEAPGSLDEGDPIDLSLSGAFDPSSADTAAGFTYAFDCGDGGGFGAYSPSAGASCATSDDGLRTVRGRISDKDGGVTEYSATVDVRNVPPTATFTTPTNVNEGSAIALSLNGASDPSTVDTATGFEYAFDCGDGSGFGSYSGTSTTDCNTTDNGSRTVQGRVRDKDGGVSTYSAVVTIDNVAPTATFNAPDSVTEGSAIALSLSSPTDPSSVDTAAGFEYAFDCGTGSGFDGFSTTSTATCSTNDDGTRAVGAKIRDKDGGVTEYGATVSIDNVAPSATFTANSPVNEGSDIGLSFTSPTDPSSVDTAAGFEYAFDCGTGSGFGGFTATSTATCSTNDDGTRAVGAKIRDKDGGVTEYGATVSIDNVAPSATFTANSPVNEGSDIGLSLSSPTDPSSVDTLAGFEYAFDCGDGGGFGGYSATSTATCSTNDDGTRAVGAKIRDKDGGVTEYGATVSIDNVAPSATFTANSPVNEGSDIGLSLSSPTDPSSVDTLAGFEYAFDCGDGGGFGGFSATSTATCSTNDNGTRAVGAKIRDKDGGVTEYGATVSIDNVAPTATFGVPVSVAEGSPLGLSLTDPSDPSSVDTAAGFGYAFDCGDGAGFGGSGPAASTSCATDDNGGRLVGGRISDKDGGTTDYTATVTVSNVAPTATFAASSPVDEGSDISLALTDPTDPSSADTTAGFTYAFDCGSGFGAYSPASATACPTTDNGTPTVGGKIRDKDGGISTYSASVTINNVAPMATFNAPASVNEGSAIALSLTGASDPSSADTTAGFTYAFDCGAGLGTYTSTPTASCPTTDNGTRTVGAGIRDKDGGTSTYSASVTINNVAPMATFNAPASVNEGSAIALSLTGASDPSSADTTAGFTYAFDCGAGLGTYTSSPTASCPTTDNGTRTVGAGIRDKDGGTNTYSASVTINNVAPTIQSFAIAQASGSACASNAVSVSFTVVDPADQSADPITGVVNWGDGNSTPIAGRSIATSHSYAPGVFSLSVSVNDGDSGTATAGTPANVSLLYGTSGVLQPIDAAGTSTFKIASTIPTKVRVTDCAGTSVGTAVLQVQLTKLGTSSSPVNEVVSSSAADNGDLMRFDGQQYIFNLSTKRSQFNAGNDLTAGRYRMQIMGPSIPTVMVEFNLRS